MTDLAMFAVGMVPLAALIFGVWVGRSGAKVQQRNDAQLDTSDRAWRIDRAAEADMDEVFDDGWPNKEWAEFMGHDPHSIVITKYSHDMRQRISDSIVRQQERYL